MKSIESLMGKEGERMRVKVFVPATTANLGSGYDVVGLALNFGNTVEMIETNAGVKVELLGEGKELLYSDRRNIIYQAAKKLWDRENFSPRGLLIKSNNVIPLARGLGSSATAIVGGLLCANYFCGNKYSKEEIFQMATEIEGHPDNVAPAIFGGFVISYQRDTFCHQKLQITSELNVVLAVPDYQLPTKKARNAVPKKIPIQDAVFNLSRVALLVNAFAAKDYSLLTAAMEDKIHQQYRASLMPGMEEAFAAAKSAGAVSVAVSGAGPTVIAFTDGTNCQRVGTAMKDAYNALGINTKIIFTTPRAEGAL